MTAALSVYQQRVEGRVRARMVYLCGRGATYVMIVSNFHVRVHCAFVFSENMYIQFVL